MRLKRTMLCALALLLAALPAMAQGEPFFLINDETACISLEVTGVEMTTSSLRYYVVVENQSGRELDFRFEDAYADGVEVDGIGIFDVENGERREGDFFFFKPLDGDDMDALEGAERISCNIVVKNSETYDEIMTVPVTMSTQAFEEETAAQTYSTPRPTAAPQVLLVLPDGGWGEWEYTRDNMLRMRVTVENTSAARAVEAFEIYMYATNAWDEPIYGEDYVYFGTTQTLVEPFETALSEYVTMPRADEIERVYAGIHRVRYDDGSIVEADPVIYHYWDIE